MIEENLIQEESRLYEAPLCVTMELVESGVLCSSIEDYGDDGFFGL